jgi:hypothetical protein
MRQLVDDLLGRAPTISGVVQAAYSRFRTFVDKGTMTASSAKLHSKPKLSFVVCEATDRCPSSSGHSTAMIRAES